MTEDTEGLMIYMDDGLLVDQVVFPLFHTLNQGIKLLVISGIVYHNLTKILRIATNQLLLLHQYSSHGITSGIGFDFEWLLEIG